MRTVDIYECTEDIYVRTVAIFVHTADIYVCAIDICVRTDNDLARFEIYLCWPFFFLNYPNFGTFLLNKKYYWGTKTSTLSHVPIDYPHVFSGELTIDQQCRIISVLNFLIL